MKTETENFKKLREAVEKHAQKGKNAMFGSEAHMLYVLRTAYRFALDLNAQNGGKKRLSRKEEVALGRNLAMYWGYKMVLPKDVDKGMEPSKGTKKVQKAP